MLLKRQNKVCAICLQPSKERFHVDHDHSHHHSEKYLRSCKECIRGLLCRRCNMNFIDVAAKYTHLQNDFIKAYLKQRPFIDGIDDIGNSVFESKIIITP